MSALHRLFCRLGLHDWRSGICFHCGKRGGAGTDEGVGKGRQSPGRSGGRLTQAPTRVSPARSAETQALADHTAAAPLPPKAIAASPPASPPGAPPAGEEATVAAELRPGDVVLDLYEVKEVFTSGGMGLVYRVHHRGWNVDLAVKSPRAEHFRTEEQRQQFEREIDAWIGLGLHPHIASCYYVRTLGGVPRVFAELVAGGTLEAWIKNQRLYAGGREAAQERLLDVALQIARAMDYAHTQGTGMVHQDLKPRNVLMTTDGTAKVTDFGLAQARRLSGEAAAPPADGGTVYVDWGGWTPAYGAPEQDPRGPRGKLSRKTDIWSWAVTVLEMYLGGLPWEPNSPGYLILTHALDGYLRAGAQDPAIPSFPSTLQDLLRHCLNPNPAERPADFGTVTKRLAGIYRAVVGRDYPRVPPVPAELQADALNNRAISMLDLGRETEAQALFEQALAQEPGHSQATYNWGLVRWRRGEITDLEVVRQLEQARDNRRGNWVPPYLLGLVHLERCDAAGAQAALIAATALVDRPEIRAALKRVKQRPDSAEGRLLDFRGDTRERLATSSYVTAMALSADGRQALFGVSNDLLESEHGTLWLWDIGTGQCRGSLKGHTEWVTSIILSLDGRHALSGSGDKTLRAWDLSNGKCLKAMVGHTAAVNSVALSADGCLAISGSSDKTLCHWDLNNGKCLRTLQGHSGELSAVALNSHGNLAISGGSDNTLRVWDLNDGNCVRTLMGHNSGITSVALSADGKYALSGSADNTLRLWDCGNGNCLRILNGHSAWVTFVAFSADGHWVLSGGKDNTLRIWSLHSGRCIRTLSTPSQRMGSLAVSARGCLALSADQSVGQTFRLWDLGPWLANDTAVKVPWFLSAVTEVATLLAVQERYRRLLAQADTAFAAQQWAEAWRLADQASALPGYRFDLGILQRTRLAGWRGGVRRGLNGTWCQKILLKHTGGVTSLALRSDGRLAVSGSKDNSLRLWDVDNQQCVGTLGILSGQTGGVTSVALSYDGRFALSGEKDGTLRLWDLDDRQCCRVLEENSHRVGVTSVALSNHCRLALSASRDCTLRLWNLASGQCRILETGIIAWETSVALTADGELALSGSQDGNLRHWDTGTGQCLISLKAHIGGVTTVALSADGRRALSGGIDKILRWWDLGKVECRTMMEGHTDWVTSVALSADGHWALSGSRDHTSRLWDLDSGECLGILKGHTGEITSVALCADGRYAVSGSEDQSLRLWELDWDYAFPEPQDWDEAARPYLRNFLSLHAQTAAGHPTWDENAWQDLQRSLCDAGFGWLRPEGVRRELNQMTYEWTGA